MAYGAFQSNAVQRNACQIGGPAQTQTDQATGGYYYSPPVRSDDERRAERLRRMGLTPKPVQKVVQKIAQKIAKAALQQPDPLAYLQAQFNAQQTVLRAELAKKQQEFEQQYLLLLWLDIELRIQEEEDEQIVHLLMEM